MTERFAINVDPRESHPRRLDPREWLTLHGNQNDQAVALRDANTSTAASSNRSESETQSLMVNLLAGVLAFLFVEQALAWRFTAGVAVAILSLALATFWMAMRFL